MFVRRPTLVARELQRRSGFTVPELAVVLAVLLCCLAVAAPSLLKSWEASRQQQCRERLKLLAMGVVSHLDARQQFPAGQTARQTKSNAIGRYADPDEPRDTGAGPASGASWVVVVLPYCDQKSLFDQWDQKRSVAANRQIAETELPLLYCPSRRALGGGLAAGCERVGIDWSRGGNDYAACSGSGITFNDEARQTWDLDAAQLESTTREGISPYSNAAAHRGVFGVNTAVSRADVEGGDGLAYVLMLAERRVFRGTTAGVQQSSDGWAWGGPATLFSTRYAPHTGVHFDEADSAHPGVVHVALADARVQPINWNIDLRTWNNLGNTAQGTPIQHPDFR